jgi:hypothetical protein
MGHMGPFEMVMTMWYKASLKEWQAMIQKSSAKKELRGKLARVFHEGMQKQK